MTPIVNGWTIVSISNVKTILLLPSHSSLNSSKEQFLNIDTMMNNFFLIIYIHALKNAS